VSDVTQSNLALARRYLEIDQSRRALEVLEGRQNDLDDPEYWLLRAQALLDLEREHDALAATRQGLQLDPDDVALLRQNAIVHTQLGDLAAAERSLLGALRHDPEDPGALAQYALLVARAGQLDKARRLVDEAERIAPVATGLSSVRAVIAYLAGDDRAAKRHAEELLAEDPDGSAAHLLRGSILAERGAAFRARRHFETAARLDPGDHDVVSVARRSRWATHPLLWPLIPFQRFGAGKVWLGVIALFVVGAALHAYWLAEPVILLYLLLVIYSWTVPPLVLRLQKRKSR
jgi:tetratricopeptide (TPR) repeat protein